MAFGLLVVLAALGLWVGVANDAVNFLNSAIGSHAGTLRRILLVAALGTLAGTLLSSGMMEVARKGVFHPDLFSTPEGGVDLAGILTVYLAAMVANLLVLDLFNSLGLPISTTVSILSNLAGAAVGTMLWRTGGDPAAALAVLNAKPLGGIYMGIFASVGIAFLGGLVLMVLVRLAFTQDPERAFARYGWIWAGWSVAVVCWSILRKGVGHVPLLGDAPLVWARDHLWEVSVVVFAVAALWAWIRRRDHARVLRVLILVGTGTLALSFAANDLVNFTGPTVAAGQAMFVEGVRLSGQVPTPAWALLVSGMVMVLALHASRKARAVTDTEIRLAARGETEHRFGGSLAARSVVRMGTWIGRGVTALLPSRIRNRAADRLAPKPGDPDHGTPYDLLRASVNLTVASTLISIGTSMKLPLSTTYITFMVAMGAALGDGVWDRGSAERRVHGILVVVGGWIVTGLAAFLVSGLLAFGLAAVGLGAGVPLAVVLLGASMLYFHRLHGRIFRGRVLAHDRLQGRKAPEVPAVAADALDAAA